MSHSLIQQSRVLSPGQIRLPDVPKSTRNTTIAQEEGSLEILCACFHYLGKKAFETVFIPRSGEGRRKGSLEAGCKHTTPKTPIGWALRLAGCLLAASCSCVFHKETCYLISATCVVSHLNSSLMSETRTREVDPPNSGLPNNKNQRILTLLLQTQCKIGCL